MENLQNRNYNLIFILLFSAISFLVYHQSGALDNAGMAALILNWLPLIFGLFSLILFFIIRLFSKKYAWIGTLAGVILNTGLISSAFLSA